MKSVCMIAVFAALLPVSCLCEESELQRRAQELADYAVREGLQGALQFCAFKNGKCIIDVHAGTMTTNAGATKISGNTLFPIFSTEKPILATAVHRAVEQGMLAYDAPVSTVWPAFKGGGKERLTVRELLGYRSGMPDGTDKMDFSPEGNRVMSDWRAMLDWFASVPPDIVPGTTQRYMAKSYGWAHGGLLEKVWKKPANDVLREQVLIPAGIENDFYFVCGDDEIPRVATVYRGGAFESMNDDLARRSFLPSAWAVASARGIAQFYNRLCGFDGRPPLLKRETLDGALKPCRHQSDPVPDAEGLKDWHMVFGMGYGLWGEADDLSRVFGHGGVGGSEGLCDRSQRIAVGYTCNFDQAPPKLREAFYSLAGIRWRYWSQDVNIQDLQMATMRPDSTKHDTASIASFCERAERREPLTVAFFGGSLTWGANATDPNVTSWRGRICERLRTTYPSTPFRFVDAAIGGTGSELGVFRLERDVLKFKPDLMFHEWSVNDGFAYSNDNASCSYEGIIRRVLAELPGCVPVPVILPDRKTMTGEPDTNLRRRAEHLAIAESYNLNAVDVLGTLRKVYESGKDETDLIWPAEIGDNTHPHDYGYGIYADVIWDAVFAHPTGRVPKLTPEPLFSPKYAHICRQRLNALGPLPTGWAKGYNAMRAGTFDFLCSRRQDGIVRATNKDGTAPSPFRLRFRGEVLLIYGESTVKSGKCEVWVDGKCAATRDCSDFGTLFAPSAYLLWPIASNLNPDKIHELEIRPILKDGEVQEVNIESICVAGRNDAWVRPVEIERPVPSAALTERLEAEEDVIGIVHWGLNTYTDHEWGYGDENPKDLNPTKFDADQICRACADGGLKGLVVVAKHHDGFCLWPTKTTEHNITKSPFRGGKGDYVREMANACRKAGMKLGVYVSPWDRNSADYGTAKYVETYHAQIKELLDGSYGEVFEMWFDGANGGDGYYGGAREKRRIPNGYYRFDEVFKFVREFQPKVCIFAGEHDTADFRWPGNERGDLNPDSRATICTVGGYVDGKYGNPDYGKYINTGCADGRFFKMCEADFPLRPGWFYHAKERGKSKHAAYLMNRYLVTVGNGGTMNIGIAPNKDGLLDEEDVKALKGFGELRKAFFANEVTDPAKPFNLVVLREDISRGEQVDDWSFLVNDEKVLFGKSIGHKRIRILDRPMVARRGVRIVTDKGSVSYRLYFVNPELVQLVQSATTESGETDTAKWMTGAEKER